jgi:hypothetical protein
LQTNNKVERFLSLVVVANYPMTLFYVEHTTTVNGVVNYYEKPNFNSKNDAIEYYNKLWWTYGKSITEESNLAFTAKYDDTVVNVRVGATVL